MPCGAAVRVGAHAADVPALGLSEPLRDRLRKENRRVWGASDLWNDGRINQAFNRGMPDSLTPSYRCSSLHSDEVFQAKILILGQNVSRY
jgi:hypothetical protein